jgi:hypothetical protein
MAKFVNPKPDKRILSGDVYVANILATYDRATAQQRKDGEEWYPAMFRIMREHAEVTGYSIAQCAAVYAATSINTSWSINLTLAARALADGGLSGGTLGMVVDKVNRILAGDDIDSTLSGDPSNFKLRQFYRNLSGNYFRVTVDRWARRIATGDYASKSVPKGREYECIARAYVHAALRRNVTPATMQAVTWCVARGDGE